jgi:hypothetical protein
MSILIEFWKAVTDSLNTRGGTIALLFVSTVVLGVLNLHILHRGDESSAAAVLQTTFANFTGALLLALTSGGKGPEPPKP